MIPNDDILSSSEDEPDSMDDGDKPEGVEEASEDGEIDNNISHPKTTENEQVYPEEKTEKGEEKTRKERWEDGKKPREER